MSICTVYILKYFEQCYVKVIVSYILVGCPRGGPKYSGWTEPTWSVAFYF